MSPPALWFAPTGAVGFSGLAAGRVFSDVAPWLAMLVVLVVIGGFVLANLRKRMRRGDDGPSDGFTLHDLRQLHARGELSDEEYERARDHIIQRVRGRDREDASGPSSNESETDGR